MADKDPKDEFISISQVLDLKPRLGPIPGEQVFPWIAIMLGSYLLCQGLLGQSWVVTVAVSMWGIGTWWALTGDSSWRFLSKFRGVPKWVKGYLPYQQITSSHQPASDQSNVNPPRKKLKKIR